MAMGLEADSLGIVDDVHELVVDHSDSSVGDARDAHEVAVSHSGSETFLEGLSSSLGDAPDAPPGKAPLERGISAIDLIEHELLAAAEADERESGLDAELPEVGLDAAHAAADSAEAKYALDPPPAHEPRLTHAKLSWTDIMRGDIIDDEAETDGAAAAGPPPPLPDEVRPWKTPPSTNLAARLLACWTCDAQISCLRVQKLQRPPGRGRPGPASPTDHV